MSDTPAVVDIVEEEENYGMVDGPHIEIAFDALEDTLDQQVTGTESLTQAQMYMHGVLSASGQLTRAEVNGSEGFFSNVGAGLKKTWEYIVKMFKNIWGFFFKKKAPELAKNTKRSIDDAKTALDMKDVSAAKASMSRALVYVADGQEIGELRDYLKEANTRADLNNVASKFARANVRARKVLTLKIGNLIETCKGALSLTEHAKTEAAKHDNKELTAFVNAMSANAEGTKHLQTELEKIRELEDFNLARAFLNMLTGYVTVVEKEITTIGNEEAKVRSSIDSVEKSMGTEKNAEATKQVAGLRALMALAAKCSSLLKRCLEEVQAINKAMPRVFGL